MKILPKKREYSEDSIFIGVRLMVDMHIAIETATPDGTLQGSLHGFCAPPKPTLILIKLVPLNSP